MYDYSKSVLKIIKETKRPDSFTLSKPAKISLKDKSAFSLPAGPKFACPGATEACGDCYAQKGRHVFKSVQQAFVKNWKMLKWFESKKDVRAAAQAIAASIPKSRDIFRIHESGDFHSQFAVDVWTEVVRLRRDIGFWAYTRSFDFNYSKLVRQPNMRLWASTDDYNRKEARRFVKRYSRSNVKHAYGPWQHNREIPKNSFVCPATSGALNVVGACEKCMLCIGKKTKKSVVFMAH